jgi:hypothetical protein
MAEKLGEAVLELRTVDGAFNTGVDKAEGRAKQLGATLDVTAGSALELADKMAQAGRAGGEGAAVWQRAAASIDVLAAAQAQAKAEVDIANASLKAAKITQEEYNRTILLSKAALAEVEEQHRQAQSALQRHIASTNQATGATGAQRAGLAQLGFQLGDVSTMYALGMRPQQIFASQIGQVAQSIQLLAGEGSKFARFLGGPWGIALMIGVQVLGPFVGMLFEAKKATEELHAAENNLSNVQSALGNVFDLTTGKIKDQSDATIALARATLELAKAQSQQRLMEANRSITKSGQDQREFNAGFGGGISFRRYTPPEATVESNYRNGVINASQAQEQLKRFYESGSITQERYLELVNAYASAAVEQINVKQADQGLNAIEDRKLPAAFRENKRDRKSKTGKTEAEVEQAYQRDLASLNQEELQAKLSLATSAQERADIQYQMLADQRVQREAEINANKDYSEAQKKQLLAALDALYGKKSADGTILVSGGLLKDRIARDQIEAEKRLDAEMLSRQQQTLEAWARVAGTSADRAALELQSLQLQQQIERNLLEQQIATSQIADAAQARALLESRQAAEREGLRQANAGPLERYTTQLRRNKLESGERVEELMVEELDYVHQSLTDTISSRLGVKDPFLRGLIDMFVEDVFIRPMAEALEQARGSAGGGGGGGFFASLFSSLLGGGGGASPLASLSSSAASTIADPAYAGLFATGGMIPAGGWGIAGEAGPEPVFAGAGGAVIMPNSTAGSRLGGGGQTILQLDLRGAVVTEDLLRQMNDIAQQTTAEGLSQYDSVVGDRVKEHLERRG